MTGRPPSPAAALEAFGTAVLVYFLFVNSSYALLLGSAALELRRHRRVTWHEERLRLLSSEVAPGISLLAPAYDEAATVAHSVRALLTLRYPDLEIVLVNDGSADATLDVLAAEFRLVPLHPAHDRRLETKPLRGLYRSATHPNLVVVDKENGGKADALNAGLEVAGGALVCAIDADTLVEPDALLRLVRPFLAREDVVAAGGSIRVVNGCTVRAGRVVEPRVPRSPLAGIQAVEYLRAFLFGRLGWNRLGGNLVISGAFGLFRREAVLAVGGYTHDTVGEDMELVAKLRRRGRERGGAQRVDFVPDPVAWTEVPESLRVLGRQRDRWHRGLADVLWRHRGLLGNPRYGALGLVVVPYFLLVELLAPVVETLGLLAVLLGLATGTLDVAFGALFLSVAYGYALLLNVATLVLQELGDRRYRRPADHLLLVAWALLESVGYRQLTLVWRLRGIVKYLRRRRDWGQMSRKGFGPP